MCVKCGGTCGKRRNGPRFTRAAGSADLSIKGTHGGPDHLPDALITQRGGMITFESLYTTLSPNGTAAVAVIPGTFGSYATKSRPGRVF